jgi:hypothetical protein
MTELSQEGASWMVDATPEMFAAEVFDRSQELPVVVDHLVKANTEQSMRRSSISSSVPCRNRRFGRGSTTCC